MLYLFTFMLGFATALPVLALAASWNESSATGGRGVDASNEAQRPRFDVDLTDRAAARSQRFSE